MRSIRAIGLCACLGACATPSAPVVTVTCLPMATYDAAFEANLAGAVAALGPDNPIVRAMSDYGALRAQDRACLSSNTGALK